VSSGCKPATLGALTHLSPLDRGGSEAAVNSEYHKLPSDNSAALNGGSKSCCSMPSSMPAKKCNYQKYQANQPNNKTEASNKQGHRQAHL